MTGRRICIVAGMIDAKLSSKLAPLQEMGEIQAIDLVRRTRFMGKKVRCHTPGYFFRSWLPLAEFWRLLTLAYLGVFRRPAVIVAFGTVPHGVYAWIVGKLLRIPVVQHVMGKNDLRLTFPGSKGRRLTLAAVKAGELVAVRGSRMRQWLMDRGVSEDRIFIPQNVHDFALFTPREAIAPRYDLIYVGLLSAYKRIDLMLEMVACMLRQRRATTLLLVGDGPERSALESKASALGVAGATTFAGRRTFSDLPGYFRSARVFVMTSQGEGLPMAMIEAMSCGLPAVVPDDADLQEVAQDGVNAVLVNDASPEGFATAVLEILDNTDLYERLRNGALQTREQYRLEFSLEFQTGVWRTALERIPQWRASKVQV